MNKRTMAALSAAAVGCTGLGAFAATGFGEDATAEADRVRLVRPALEATDREPPAKSKGPRITNLITIDPVAVAANDEVVTELTCKKSQGIPLSGGAISPPAPAQVSISVVSRYNPTTLETPTRRYYVGVRNLDPVNPAEFRATLVCGKGIEEE